MAYPMPASADDPIDEALTTATSRYADKRRRTRAMQERADARLPGGNTRTVLYHPPFPIRVARAWDGIVEDVDGHRYVDLLGDYSAGLYGHSHPAIGTAVAAALRQGLTPGAHTAEEVAFAEALTARFPTVERVRFTNSGTEANLMAVTAARAFTGRNGVVVFRGAYHGAVLTYVHGGSPVNAPYDVLVAPYNDPAHARAVLERNADSVAAVLVEPMLGAGGCIPGEQGFLRTLRETTTETGALLVLDEVMTSRTGRAGMAERLGISADLTTFGKYLGGGFSCGAFGGRADVMALFDPSRRDALPHAGTFNNNRVTMVAGCEGLTRVYTPEVAETHTARGDSLRASLDAVFRQAGARLRVTGVGSLMNVHATTADVRSVDDVGRDDERLKQLFFLDLLEAGYYIAPRGYMALSLAVTEDQLAGFLSAVDKILAARRGVLTG